ncbi:hypothetical protein IFM89_002086 [Coptis chinensis]|uniref:Uncharacterized protein n=1 Tax=Coptis chinensis TaxID=261450 RepID=A0A835LKY7_9MAGN|nr:hypothetical protein IFM89_002086 [Coptis chinensis]
MRREHVANGRAIIGEEAGGDLIESYDVILNSVLVPHAQRLGDTTAPLIETMRMKLVASVDLHLLKCVSINEFLKPAEGEKYYNPGGRGRGRGRGGRGDGKALHEAAVDKVNAEGTECVFDASLCREYKLARGSAEGQQPTLRKEQRSPSDILRTSSTMRKASSTTNIVDDLTSIFGGASSSGEFQDVEGETEERRRVRLDRHQRTQERAVYGD